MSPHDALEITFPRLTKWGLFASTHGHTPMLLVTCGHDRDAGDVMIHVPEEVTHGQIVELLRGVLQRLEEGHGVPRGNGCTEYERGAP